MSFFKKILNKIPFLNKDKENKAELEEEMVKDAGSADSSEKSVFFGERKPTLEEILAEHELKSVPQTQQAILDEKPDERIKLEKRDLETLEEELIRSDLGVNLAMDFVEKIREQIKSVEIYRDELQKKLQDYLLSAFDEILREQGSEKFALELSKEGPTVVMILGVNGVGKTTSIAKLAHKFKNEGKKVLIAAGDTFRAAAEDQLRTWAERTGTDLIEMPHGSKSSAVVYKAIEKAKEESYDVVLVDTAGRLHNKKNLMEELSKIKQVIEKNLEEGKYLLETMLVLDSSMGQNSLSQAEAFNEICDLDSIILTKFDGSSKAGVVFSIAHKLKLPVKFLGTGEKMEDLESFSVESFTRKYF